MSGDVPAPTDVLTLVFLAWTVGTLVGGVVTRMWGEVQPGHFKVVWLVCTALGVAAGFGYRPAWLLAVLSLLSFLGIYRGIDRVLGIIAAAVAVIVLTMGADLSLHAFAAAALLGAATNAMLLGHWHLNQPRLGTKPIARLVRGLWAALVLYVAATGVLMAVALRDAGGVRMLGAGTALAFTVFAAVLTALVHHLVRTRSIMSATGILYLEILLCFVAVFTGSLAALATSGTRVS
jgi:hypothetical protein